MGPVLSRSCLFPLGMILALFIFLCLRAIVLDVSTRCVYSMPPPYFHLTQTQFPTNIR